MLDFKNFELLTFDCYGTLVDWETGILQALRPILAAASVEVEDALLLGNYAQLESQIEAGPYRSYVAVLGAVLDGLGSELGFTPTEVNKQAFAESVGDWPAFADTPAALAKLADRFQLGILSNIDDAMITQSRKRIGEHFSHVFTAQAIGSYKPSSRNFEYLLAHVEQPKEKILHVAQSLFHDVKPAKELGLHTVWINRRSAKPGYGATPPAEATPDAEFADLASFAAAACG